MKEVILDIFNNGGKHEIQELYASVAPILNVDKQDPKFQKDLRGCIDSLKKSGNIRNVSHGVWEVISSEEHAQAIFAKLDI